MTAPRYNSRRAKTPSWHSAHIYYYEPNKDGLILDAIRPTVQELRRTGTLDAYLVRHWRQGPHLRLNVRTSPRNWEKTAEPLIARTVGHYLRVQPSTAILDQRAELRRQVQLARQERERGPLSPWFLDNTIQYPPYDGRLHVLGSQQVANLLADFAASRTQPLFDMLHHLRAGRGSKELLALSLVLATWHVEGTPPQAAYLDSFLPRNSTRTAARAELDHRYEQLRETSHHLLHQVRATVGRPLNSASLPFVNAWSRLVGQYARRASPLLTDPATQRSQFAHDCTLQHLAQLGLSSHQRGRTCYLAARTVRDDALAQMRVPALQLIESNATDLGANSSLTRASSGKATGR